MTLSKVILSSGRIVLTFPFDLALDVRVVDHLAQCHAAEQGAQQALPPAAAVGAVEHRHAEVTGQVGALPEHGGLQGTAMQTGRHRTRQRERGLERERDSERKTERDAERHRHRDTDRDSDTGTETQREADRERQTERQRDRQ